MKRMDFLALATPRTQQACAPADERSLALSPNLDAWRMTRRAGFQDNIAPRARRLPVEHPARVVLMHPVQHVHEEVLTGHLSAGSWGESEGCRQAARCTGSVGLPRKRRCATVHVGIASPARCCAESVTLHASQVVRRT